MKKTILITGCSSGFGRATARLFAWEGWNVVATMRRPEEEQNLNKLPNVLVTRLDVQDHESIASAIEAGIARFDSIDVLVNNVGSGLFGPFEAAPPEKNAGQIDVNVFKAMAVTRAILPHFRENKGGLILNVSSGADVFTLPMLSLYCASKFVLEGFIETLSYDLASQRIVAKLVEPGGVVSTNFGQRSGAEVAHNAALPDYAPFAAPAQEQRTQEFFAGLRAARLATEDHVAQVLFNAATDGTDRHVFPRLGEAGSTQDVRDLHTKRSTLQ